MLYNICDPKRKYRDLKELCQHNLWWDIRNKKGFSVKEEILQELKKPIQKEESEFTRNKPLVLFVLGIVVLLGMAALTRAEKISHSLEEVRENSIQQLFIPNR